MSMSELKQKIVDLCNESGLSIEAVVFVLKDAFRDAEDAFVIYQTKKLKKEEEENKEISSKENIIMN